MTHSNRQQGSLKGHITLAPRFSNNGAITGFIFDTKYSNCRPHLIVLSIRAHKIQRKEISPFFRWICQMGFSCLGIMVGEWVDSLTSFLPTATRKSIITPSWCSSLHDGRGRTEQCSEIISSSFCVFLHVVTVFDI